MADVVHKSSHPSLPPAAPEQVVQYLLAKNFHLTALELLVEAQQAGHGDDVRDLEAFFSDRDRFPPEELARYQPDNAFDLQAAGKDRESRLQLAEYELRLAKEDLAEMARKLAQAQERQQQQQQQLLQLQKAPSMAVTAGPAAATPAPAPPMGAGAAAGAAPSPFSSTAPGLPPPTPSASPAAGPQLGPPGAAPTPAEQRALNTAVFAHLLRQGLVTTAMTMEEEYGGSLRGTPATHGSSTSDAEHPWELWSWYQAAARSAPAGEPATSIAGADAVAAGGAAAAAAAAAGSVAPSTTVAEAALAAVAAAAIDPEDIIQQFDLGGETSRDGSVDADAADGGALPADADGSEPVDAAALRAQLRAVREELAATRARARGAVVAATAAAEVAAAAAAAASATAAATQAAQRQQLQQQQLKSAALSQQSPVQQSMSYISGDASVLELLDLGPPATASGTQTHWNGADNTAAAADDASAEPTTAGGGGSGSGAQPSPARLGSGAVGQNESAAVAAAAKADGSTEPPWRRIDPTYHASLESMLGGLCDALPRLVPNLNLKSRVEALPLIVAAAKTTTDWEVRRQLLAAVFNLAPAPDYQQRQAIIDACLEMCQAFGAGWTATELLQLCCRQSNSPSSERRTLVAETLGEAVGTVDPGTQAHVLLTQLSQLAKDRMDLVREAACHSLARLVPRLPFTRSYYTTLEGMLLPLATDACEAVHVAALSYLVPALLTWQPQDTDSMLVSSCLARVLSDISQQVRIIEQYQQAFFNHQYQQQQQHQHQQALQGNKGADATAAAAGGSGSSGFTGTFLRYTHTSSPSPPPPPASPSPSPPPPLTSEGQLGSSHSKGSSSSLSDVGTATAGAATATAATAGGSTNGGHQPLTSGPSVSAASTSGLVASPPPPPPQWVSFGRRSFPSSSHLLLYQLLALYGGLTPALRHAALRSRPDWACPADGPAKAAGASAGAARPPAPNKGTAVATAAGAGKAPGSLRHQRGGSLDGPSFTAAAAAAGTSVVAAAAAAAAAAAVPASRDQSADLMGPTHRRTSSHPAFGGFGPLGGVGSGGSAAAAAAAAAAAPGVSDGASGGALTGPRGRSSLQHAELAPLYRMLLPKSSSSTGLANGVTSGGGGVGTGEAAPTEQQRPSGAGHAVEVSQEDSEGGRAEEGGEEEVLEDWEREAEDASLAAWATHGSHDSWKTLEWIMQYVVPELIRLICCVGPMFPEALDVRRQAAFAVAATCSVMGAPFTQAAIEPVFLAASGTGTSTTAGGAAVAGSSVGGGAASSTVAVIAPDLDAPVAVRALCATWQPRTLEALRMARQCVLPVLLVSVLPAALRLRPYLLQLMGSAHELRQRWLMDALPDYTTAITFACSQRPDLLPQVLHVFEDLLSGATGAASSHSLAQHRSSHQGGDGPSGAANANGAAAPADDKSAGAAAPPAAPAAAGPASTHVGLCCAALARALVPVASLELASRRILPGLMALMSYGEPELQRACVGVLAELGLRFRGDGPRVSEQVLVVYDSLLEQGGHGVQLEVLAAGTALAAAAAPSAAVSAAAAAQVEWLLTAVQAVAARLTAPASAGGTAATAAAGPGLLTQDQQRALAAQLLAALRAVAPYDLRLPRLQANLSSALDAVQRCKALLPDAQQQAALSALLKERPTGQSAASASVSSSTPSAAAAAAAAAAAGAAGMPPLRTGPGSSLPPVQPYSLHSAGHAAASATTGLAVTPTQSASGSANPFLLPPTGTTPLTHGSAHGTPDGAQASGGVRSRFDAFRQRLMKRRDDAPAAAGQAGTAAATAGAAGAKPKESFFSDDEGE